jgi:hypothetical protein
VDETASTGTPVQDEYSFALDDVASIVTLWRYTTAGVDDVAGTGTLYGAWRAMVPCMVDDMAGTGTL